MNQNNIIRVFAGGMVFVSSFLGFFYNKNWLFVSMFVGLNLFQYAFTNWCLLQKILDKIGIEK